MPETKKSPKQTPLLSKIRNQLVDPQVSATPTEDVTASEADHLNISVLNGQSVIQRQSLLQAQQSKTLSGDLSAWDL